MTPTHPFWAGHLPVRPVPGSRLNYVETLKYQTLRRLHDVAFRILGSDPDDNSQRRIHCFCEIQPPRHSTAPQYLTPHAPTPHGGR